MALSQEEVIDLIKTGGLMTAAALVGRAAWRHINKGVVITTVTWRYAVGGLAVALACGYVALGVGDLFRFDLELKVGLAVAFGYAGPKLLESIALRFIASKVPAADPPAPAAPADPVPEPAAPEPPKE
jgi:hypothetical protein